MKMKLLVSAVVLMFLSFSAYSQKNDPKYTGNAVMAVIMDGGNGDPVPFATAYISKKGDEENAFYALTNEDGMVIIDKLPLGKFIFKVELIGYRTIEKEIEVKKGLNRLGKIEMKPDIEMIDAAVVTAVGNPIVVKKDTIEYTASSYKTTENDMLESLLKKIPGIEISSDGQITANGETITKININGKTFFLDDPQLALKNIPANIVDKVKVVEELSEQSKFTGIDDGEGETVIDLSVKKGKMGGWFGNIGGGAGHDIDGVTGNKNDVRFEGAAMVAKFTEDSQLSIILNGNNTNNRGFNDIAGNAMNTMRSSMGGGRSGGGSAGNDGVVTSWMGGINGNTRLLDGKLELEGNYLYSGADKYFWQQSQKVSFLPDNVNMITDEENVQNSINQGHRAGLEIDYKLSDRTSFWFRPQFNYGYGKFDEASTFSSYNQSDDAPDEQTMVNSGTNNTNGYNSSWKTDGMFLYRQKITSTPGRTLSFFGRYSISDSRMDAWNKSVTNTSFDTEGNPVEKTVTDQKYLMDQSSYSATGRLTYTEPLGKNYFLQGNYRFSWSQNNSVKDTYDYDPEQDAYNVKNEYYSTNFKNTFLNQDIGLTFYKQEEKFTVQAGVSAQPFNTISEQFMPPASENEKGSVQTTRLSGWNFTPSARFDYNFSKTSFIRIRYRGWTNQPSITQLQPVPDNSNPLYMKLGNTALKPEFNQFLFGMFRMSDPKSFLAMHTMARFTYTKDAIINASWYNSSGVQYTAPINSKEGKYSAVLRLMLNSPIAKSDFSINTHTDMNLSSGLSYTGVGEAQSIDEIMDELISGRTTTLSVAERLQFVYRNDFLEVALGGRVQYQNSWYTEKSQAHPSTWSNKVDASIIATLPFGMEIKTNADYNFYFGYIDGYGDSQVIWNAEISQMFLKKRASLTLKVYDILNQAQNVYRVNTDNYVQDVVNNTLGRYFTLSFIYRFGNANHGNGPRGGMGGPHGPGMRR